MATDQTQKGNTEVEHCPADNMSGNHMTKPVQGVKHDEFRNKIVWVTNEQ